MYEPTAHIKLLLVLSISICSGSTNSNSITIKDEFKGTALAFYDSESIFLNHILVRKQLKSNWCMALL